MALLQTKDFKKPAGKGPYAGKSREQILALRIKGFIPFLTKTLAALIAAIPLPMMIALCIHFNNFNYLFYLINL